MASGTLTGQRQASSLDQALYAYVHSFFLHIGAARDYLAAFIAADLGRDPGKIDSLSRLSEILRPQHFSLSPILTLMRSRGFLAPSSTKGHRWEIAGWLRQVSDLRNQFVHKRSYGEMFFERAGFARAVDIQQGVYRYFRPIVIDGTASQDLLDTISNHYRHSIALFQDAAHASGFDSAIMSITDKDIISIKRS